MGGIPFWVGIRLVRTESILPEPGNETMAVLLATPDHESGSCRMSLCWLRINRDG